MIGGAPTELKIMVARQNVIGQFNRLKAKAAKLSSEQWREFFAGAMCMLIHKINTQLTRFGVEVSDE